MTETGVDEGRHGPVELSAQSVILPDLVSISLFGTDLCSDSRLMADGDIDCCSVFAENQSVWSFVTCDTEGAKEVVRSEENARFFEDVQECKDDTLMAETPKTAGAGLASLGVFRW